MDRISVPTVIAAMVFRCFTAGAAPPAVTPLPKHVTPAAAALIEKALALLADQQESTGKWAQETEGGAFSSATYDMATTCMAGLAFLAHGDTPNRGRYGAHVSAAVHWVLRHADAKTGVITTAGDASRPMYGHCFAVLFLSETAGMDDSEHVAERVRAVVTAACVVIARAQSVRGGWSYGFHDGGRWLGIRRMPTDDEGSVTIHAVQALRAAKNAGIPVDKAIIDRGLRYLRDCQGKDGGLRYRWGSGSAESASEPAISAAAYTAWAMCGVYVPKTGGTACERAARRCGRFIGRAYGDGLVPSGVAQYPFYSLLHLAQATWFMGPWNWDRFYPLAREWLLDPSHGFRHNWLPLWKGDSASGNWVYCTAAALIILQMPYRNLPIFDR